MNAIVNVNTAAVSDFERFLVAKGGSSACIIGTCHNNIPWSSLMGDFILDKIVRSPKYKKILCINLDRNESHLHQITSSSSSSSSSIAAANSDERIIYLHEEDLLPRYDSLGGIVEYIMTELEKQLEKTRGRESYAIICFSLSELILLIGYGNALALLIRMTKMVSDDCNASKSLFTSLVYTVHESFHVNKLLAQIQTLCGVVVKVIPNTGILSKDVAVEVQCIRKSSGSGKVSESIEMFSYDGYLPRAIPKQKYNKNEPDNDNNNDNDKYKDKDENRDGDNDIVEILKVPKTKASETSTSHDNNILQANTNPNPNARLITFDSTDPEFDEDSDPDADLDL